MNNSVLMLAKYNKNKIILVLLLSSAFFSCIPKRYPDALSVDDALKHFEIADGFTVETFASEPQVLSPVDMVFDEQGNIFVLEMADYPGQPAAGEGKGRIKLLKDSNGDGKIDSAIVFADKLPSATSMLPWKGGLIVTAAPDILFLKDTTGDFRADSKEIMFTGFFANNSEAQITSLRLGVDNWIYANNNGQAGEVHAPHDTGASLSMGGSDFRFRPDKGLFEKESGSGQFGLATDDWGNRFYTQNTLHIQQAPIPWRYLHRHPYLPSDRAEKNISD
ncbi:MAG TPA: PVC-type heme-binding CxxCH protein, partial [Agriterribacter sp.]|nr:PVC-type heme-binding CxxCH protein [Agriterribacter sp.]